MNTRTVLSAVTATLLATSSLNAQASVGRPGIYVIRGGTVVTGTGQRLANTDVLIRDGKIAQVGGSVNASGATIVDASGKFVYAGMIDSNTDLGLSEIGSVVATQDLNELGDYKPHMRALVAVNPSSELIPVTRANGVTAAITAPTGGLISGQAALIHLDGWTQDEMAIKPTAGVIIRYPSAGGGGGFGGFGGSNQSDPEQERERQATLRRQVNELHDYLHRAKAYDKGRDAGMTDVELPLEALRPVMNREAPAIVMADSREQIEGALRLADSLGIKIIISGGAEAWQVADQLASKNVPVILSSLTRMPGSDAAYDEIFAQAGVLHRAGVKFAFSTGDGANARHVPYHAARAVAYGLPADAAWRALTIWPAEIWGVADKIGTIEVGKSADLFIASGDPLDVRTHVSEVFIEGKRQVMDDRHTRLYQKYLNRPKPAQ
jgi:imidazolonepropionase-like amidohydrolase